MKRFLTILVMFAIMTLSWAALIASFVDYMKWVEGVM